MLLEAPPLRIISAPASLALDGPLEGLNATDVLPPLLRSGVLMDYEGYSAWERAAIEVLDRDDMTAERALAAIADATTHLTDWIPGSEPLAVRVQRAFEEITGRVRCAPVHAADRPARAFLAAHVFGSWAAYEAAGLYGVVEAVRTALATLRKALASHGSFVEAARTADLTLRHAGDHVCT